MVFAGRRSKPQKRFCSIRATWVLVAAGNDRYRRFIPFERVPTKAFERVPNEGVSTQLVARCRVVNGRFEPIPPSGVPSGRVRITADSSTRPANVHRGFYTSRRRCGAGISQAMPATA
jgi:hypothetical protein